MTQNRRRWALVAGLLAGGCDSATTAVPSGWNPSSGSADLAGDGANGLDPTGGATAQPSAGNLDAMVAGTMAQPTAPPGNLDAMVAGTMAEPPPGGLDAMVPGAIAQPANSDMDATTSGGTDAMGGNAAPGMEGTDGADGYSYEAEVVMLTSDLVVPAGQTLRVGPGTRFEAGPGVTIRVAGTLVVEGEDNGLVHFAGSGSPRSWSGIVVESGGQIDMAGFEVVDANYGIHAKAGSSYAIDAGEFGNSFKAMVLQADGTVKNSRIHGTDGFGFAPINEVSIEDVNGTLTIIDASPVVSNASFDGGSALVDMIRVGGNAAPTFDHLYITNAHCGIHANGGNNTGLTVRNSIFEGMSFGLMLYTSAPTIEDSVFLRNATDYGFCFGATEQNLPTLRNNFYSAATPLVDATCFQIGVNEAAPATTQNPSAGTQGL